MAFWYVPFPTYRRFLTPLQWTAFENIGDIVRNESFLPLPQCFQLYRNKYSFIYRGFPYFCHCDFKYFWCRFVVCGMGYAIIAFHGIHVIKIAISLYANIVENGIKLWINYSKWQNRKTILCHLWDRRDMFDITWKGFSVVFYPFIYLCVVFKGILVILLRPIHLQYVSWISLTSKPSNILLREIATVLTFSLCRNFCKSSELMNWALINRVDRVNQTIKKA